MARGLERMARYFAVLGALALACASPAPPMAKPAPSPAPPPKPPPTPVAATSAPPPEPPPPPASAVLRDGFAERHRERAMPRAAIGRHRERVVVEHTDGKTRYVLDARTFRAIATVEDTKLWDSPLTVRALTRKPESSLEGSERVLVAPGLPLERLAERDGFVRVRTTDGNVQTEGWLASRDVGPVYVPAEVPIAVRGEAFVIAPHTKIREKPGGAVLAEVLEGVSRPQVVTAVSLSAWYAEVEHRSATLSVLGFVPKSALSQPDGAGWSSDWGGMRRGPRAPFEKLVFAAGTCLYAEPWGEVVGVVRSPLRVSAHIEEGEHAAWRELELDEQLRAWAPRAGATEQSSDPQPEPKSEPLSLADGFRCAPPPAR